MRWHSVGWSVGLVAMAIGCQNPGGIQGVKNPQPAPRSITWEHIEGACQAMARDLVTIPQIQGASSPPTITFVEVVDNTEDGFIGGSKDMFLRRIRTILVRNTGGRVLFIEARPEVLARINDERSKKRRGEVSVDAATGLRQKLGVDYFLTATYDAKMARTSGRGVPVKEMLLTFHMTHAENMAIVWTNDYPVRAYQPMRQ